MYESVTHKKRLGDVDFETHLYDVLPTYYEKAHAPSIAFNDYTYGTILQYCNQQLEQNLLNLSRKQR